MKILVVDDEELLIKGIKFNLESEGYQVETAGDGLSAVRLARSGGYDLIILDLMMPQLDGLEACKQIREFSTVPIIMLTARSEESDKLLGFGYGADDYVTKPFSILELTARIRVLLRRSARQDEDVITVGDVTIDSGKRVAMRGDEAADLTAREFDLIELFMKNPGRVYSREQLLDIIWGVDYQGGTRTIDIHVRRLREKLEENPEDPRLLLTKWGVGYYIKG